MLTHDKKGTRFPTARVLNDEPTEVNEADLFGLLETLNIHGPLFTSQLLAFDAFFRKNPKVACNRLSRFYTSNAITYLGEPTGGPILDRAAPHQFKKPDERTSIKRLMMVHSLNAKGKRVLQEAGRYHPIAHGGWLHHQIACAHITSSLHLSAINAGLRFYTQDEIAGEHAGRTVSYTLKGTTYDNHQLVPDYLCAIGNKERQRYFAVEVDRGNEVGRADEPHRRKTYERMVIQYATLIGDKLYHEAYDIPGNKPLLVLFVSTSLSKLNLMASIVKQHVGKCSYILMKHIEPEAFSPYHSPAPLDLWTTPWQRVGCPDFHLNNPERQ